MPWDEDDAKRFTKKARSGSRAKQWSSTANSVLKHTGDEGQAIRIANSAVSKSKGEQPMAKRKGKRRGKRGKKR